MTELDSQRRDALPAGTSLRDYTLEFVLGHGGFGIVYRARHDELGLKVAVKEYLPVELALREGSAVRPRSGTDIQGFEDGLFRFRDEARALIAIRNHESVVSCRDFFRANGTAYLVMEYEDGVPLQELLASREAERKPFTERDLRAVMVPLVRGLSMVHEAGILHRDIKPSNILIRRGNEQPVLIDFGAAKQVVAKHSKSLAPYTEGYAALEQVADAGELGSWTDMYGVGALMWRMIAGGQPPWNPPNPLSVERRSHAALGGKRDPLPSACGLGAGRFAPRLLEVVDRCLRLPEADRVQNCGELLDVLIHEPEDRTRRSVSATAARSSKRLGRRRNWKVAAAAAVASIVLMLVIPQWWSTVFDSGLPEARVADTSSSRQGGEVDPANPEVLRSDRTEPIRGEETPLGIPRSEQPNELTDSTEASGGTDSDSIAGDELKKPDSDARIQSPDDTSGVLDQPESEVETTDSAAKPVSGRGPRDRIREIESSPDSGSTVPVGRPQSSRREQQAEQRIDRLSKSDANVRRQSNSESSDDLGLRLYWTMGSHEDDVLRIQGTPRSILKHGSTETWFYGASSVEIDARTRRVREWSDLGGALKVRMRSRTE